MNEQYCSYYINYFIKTENSFLISEKNHDPSVWCRCRINCLVVGRRPTRILVDGATVLQTNVDAKLSLTHFNRNVHFYSFHSWLVLIFVQNSNNLYKKILSCLLWLKMDALTKEFNQLSKFGNFSLMKKLLIIEGNKWNCTKRCV